MMKHTHATACLICMMPLTLSCGYAVGEPPAEQDGATIAEYPLKVPVIWDGMAAAGGRLYVSTADGRITCFAPEE